MRDRTSLRSLSPAKAGNIYGTFRPSLAKLVIVQTADGKNKKVRLNRRERRHGQSI